MNLSNTDAENLSLTPDQVEVIASGLYHLAASDGIATEELNLIKEFLDDAGAPELLDRLPSIGFDPAGAYEILESSWMRSLFLRAAVLLVSIDGEVSSEERETLNWMASGFGIEGGFEALAESVESDSF